MEIREITEYNENEILPLYTAVGWTAYTEKPEALEQGFKHSLLVLAAYEKDELLGILRAVGDGHTIIFISGHSGLPGQAEAGSRLGPIESPAGALSRSPSN